jgi:hypothetical protein
MSDQIGFIEHYFAHLAKQPDLFTKMNVDLEQIQLDSKIELISCK